MEVLYVCVRFHPTLILIISPFVVDEKKTGTLEIWLRPCARYYDGFKSSCIFMILRILLSELCEKEKETTR